MHASVLNQVTELSLPTVPPDRSLPALTAYEQMTWNAVSVQGHAYSLAMAIRNAEVRRVMAWQAAGVMRNGRRYGGIGLGVMRQAGTGQPQAEAERTLADQVAAGVATEARSIKVCGTT